MSAKRLLEAMTGRVSLAMMPADRCDFESSSRRVLMARSECDYDVQSKQRKSAKVVGVKRQKARQ